VKSAFLNMAYQGIDWQVGINEPAIDIVSEHVKEKTVQSVKQEKETQLDAVPYTGNSEPETETEEQKEFKVSEADEAALDDILKGMYGRG
jgi:hypothetical protein